VQLQKLALKYCSMNDVDRMLKFWWKKLDSHKSLLLPVNTIADFLVAKKFVLNRLEARNIVMQAKKLINKNSVNYDHFERIFAKAIFKGALINITWGMSKGDYSDEILPLPLRLKIA
jgi:hypothetical protein